MSYAWITTVDSSELITKVFEKITFEIFDVVASEFAILLESLENLSTILLAEKLLQEFYLLLLDFVDVVFAEEGSPPVEENE